MTEEYLLIATLVTIAVAGLALKIRIVLSYHSMLLKQAEKSHKNLIKIREFKRKAAEIAEAEILKHQNNLTPASSVQSDRQSAH